MEILYEIQSNQNYVLENWQFLAALAGLIFQVQFSMLYSIRFKSPEAASDLLVVLSNLKQNGMKSR